VYYGADYYPEQWPEEVWEEDVALMREAGVNLVNVGIFAWSRIQSAEGHYDWGWLDRILDLLHRNGIGAGLATATASPPPWATAAYPEMLPHDADGTVFSPGARQHFSPTSPDYRRLASELVEAIATRYATHPAVKLWHVDNELGCHLHYDYSDHAARAFRAWLQERFGTIDALNRAWGTTFWSQIYTDFEQILPPRKATYGVNPAHLLDFKRFTSDALLGLFTMQRDIIRSAGAMQPVTTNFMGAFPPANYWKWAKEMDVIADDNYPDPNVPESFRDSAFARDLMRSLKPGVPWILMEQSTNAVNWRPTNAPKKPGQMAALSMQAVAHGADGIMFFQWRQSQRGVEKFHSAMVPQVGTDSQVWRDVVALGAQLRALPETAPDSHARIALVFDWESWWAFGSGHHPVSIRYDEVVQRWYNALHRLHYSIDFVHPRSDLGAYALVIAPTVYLLDDLGAENLAAFARSGGTLLVSAFSDVVDEDDAFIHGGFLTRLSSTLGIRLEEFGALVPPPAAVSSKSAGEPASATGSEGVGEREAPFDGPSGGGKGQYLAEVIHPTTASVIGRFTAGRNEGRAALTANKAGRGNALYIATIPDDAGMTGLVRYAAGIAGIDPQISHGSTWLEAAHRGGMLTVLNHGDIPHTFTHADRTFAVDPFTWVQLEDATLDRRVSLPASPGHLQL